MVTSLPNIFSSQEGDTLPLLSLACWVFQELQDFPQEKTDLYRRGVELLLEQWDESRGIKRGINSPIYRGLSIDDKQTLLGEIAVRKLKKSQFILFEQSEIQSYIAAHLNISLKESLEVLTSIEAQHGLVVERASQVYSFSHLTLQEYFAARWLCHPSNFINSAGDIVGQRWQGLLSMMFHRSNADEFALMLKAEIDRLLTNDSNIQQFLVYLETEAQAIKASYKLVAVRAFCFAFILDSDLTLSAASDDLMAKDLMIAHALAHAQAISPDLTSALNNILGRDQYFNHAEEENLWHKLQPLHNLHWEYKKNFGHWWKTDGQNWIERLRTVLVKRQSLKQDWQFGSRQKELLRQYYDANKLLKTCLKKSGVSPNVKYEIEMALLLPSTRIN